MPQITTALSNQGILNITLNNPERLNSLNTTLMSELDTAIQQAKSDNQTKAILLTGEGKAFCAGANIKEFTELNQQSAYEFALNGQRIFRDIETLGKPSLTAVNGLACGGGCELAMSTTMRIASPEAQFGQPEVKLGIIPGFGGTQRLARLVGKGRGLENR